jgi:hypothetical protein
MLLLLQWQQQRRRHCSFSLRSAASPGIRLQLKTPHGVLLSQYIDGKNCQKMNYFDEASISSDKLSKLHVR